MSKKQQTIEVQATGPIKHGDGEKVTEYAAGDRFTVTMAEAKQLHAAGAIEQPGHKGKSQADKDAEAKAADEAAIAEANAKAEAEKKAAADAAATGQA